jgi:hypothetical protein
MTVLATNQSEMPPLLSHTALCVTLAGALGFIAVGLLMGLDFKGFAMLSIIANVVMAFVCLTACFALVWCSPEGPDRWRPFIISREAAESIFGGAATFIVLGGIAAAIALYFP